MCVKSATKIIYSKLLMPGVTIVNRLERRRSTARATATEPEPLAGAPGNAHRNLIGFRLVHELEPTPTANVRWLSGS